MAVVEEHGECDGNQVLAEVGIGNVMGTQSNVWLVQQWEHDGYTESQVLESIGNAMGTMSLKCSRTLGTRHLSC